MFACHYVVRDKIPGENAGSDIVDFDAHTLV